MLVQFELLSKYNQLMNQRCYDTSKLLSNDDLCENRGAFFKSVLGTLNHILVGDIIWLQRFATHPSSGDVLLYVSDLEKPKSLSSILYSDLESLSQERKKIDVIIIQWIKKLSFADLADTIIFNDMVGNKHNKLYCSLINHLFLHQVHHRGQITTLLSQSGLDFGDTDLLEII